MRVNFLAGMLLLLAVLQARAADPAPLQPGRFHFEKKIEADIGFLLVHPKGFDADPTKRWPLVVFLHGTPERGDNPDLVTTHGPPKQAKAGRDFPFVLVAPQCPANERWQNDVLLGFIDRIIETQRIDTNRVYLTGLSMGGYGTWYLGLKHPERFAALAPVCGGGQVLDVLAADHTREELRRMPVWSFHGAKDTMVPPAESAQMVEALRGIGNRSVKSTVYPDEGHECWTTAYQEPEFYTWLLSQTRAGRFTTVK